MSSTTTRMGLYKPASGENINVDTDLNQNWDKIDAYLGFASCTSTTRPTTVWAGLCIYETNTGNTYVSNGTAPASASWVQIPNSGSAGALNLTGASSGADTFTVNVSGDTQKRLIVNANGMLEWGSGSGAVDTNLYRSAASELTTDDALTVMGELKPQNLVRGQRASATDSMIESRVTADGNARWFMQTDGKMWWGPGSATQDTNLYRDSTGNLLKTDDSFSVGGNLSVTGIGQTLFARKTADQGIATTTVTDVTSLGLSLSANAVYELSGLLLCTATGNTPDIKFVWTFPAGTTLAYAMNGPQTGSTVTINSGEYLAITTSTSGSGTISIGATTTQMGTILRGVVVTSGTAGTLQLRYSQNTSDPATITVKAQSYISARRVA